MVTFATLPLPHFSNANFPLVLTRLDAETGEVSRVFRLAQPTANKLTTNNNITFTMVLSQGKIVNEMLTN